MGPLIRAKLTRPIAPATSGAVAAEVIEDVVKDGAVLVPRGSTIACSSKSSSDGRVPLSCDTITTATGMSLAFRGLAVGEGHHVGLRVRDDGIPAGTAFVVYVDASAMVR